jgi:hypothetical protein
MGLRSAGKPALLLKLADVCEASTAALTKDVKPHLLIVVHSKEVDDAGEANVGLPYDAPEQRAQLARAEVQVAGHGVELAPLSRDVVARDEPQKLGGVP